MESRIKKAFIAAFGIPEEMITDQLLYQGISEWDSISHMILISELESEFDIMIETDDVLDMSSFLKAKEIIAKYQ